MIYQQQDPSSDRTQEEISRVYYWPTMRFHIDMRHSVYPLQKHDGTTKNPATMQYPPLECPRDIISINLLQYPLMCVYRFSRFAVLAPVKNKTAASLVHALFIYLQCPYTTPRILLSDNGTEFRNYISAEIRNQYKTTLTFTAAYHPAFIGLVERVVQKLLDALQPVINSIFEY